MHGIVKIKGEGFFLLIFISTGKPRYNEVVGTVDFTSL